MAKNQRSKIEVPTDHGLTDNSLNIVRLTNNKLSYDRSYHLNVGKEFDGYKDSEVARVQCQRMIDVCLFPKSEKQGFSRLLTRHFAGRFNGYYLNNEGDYTYQVHPVPDGRELNIHGELTKVKTTDNETTDNETTDNETPNMDVKVAEQARQIEEQADQIRDLTNNLHAEEKTVEEQGNVIEATEAAAEQARKDKVETEATLRRVIGWINDKSITRKELIERVANLV